MMTSLISGDAQIGFMGSEASIYVYQEGSDDPAVNFAQLTQRAGNFLVGRQAEEDFKWQDLRGKTVLGGRAGGMPQMVFEYILKRTVLILLMTSPSTRASALASPRRHFTSSAADYTIEFEPFATTLEMEGSGAVVASLEQNPAMYPIRPTAPEKAI